MPEDEKDSHLQDLLSNIGPTSEIVEGDKKYYKIEVDGYIFWIDRETLEITSQGTSKEVEIESIIIKDLIQPIEIKVGETKLINIELKPDGARIGDLEYEIPADKEEIIEVKNGAITGLKAQEEPITIIVRSKTNSSVQATFQVKVIEIAVTGITVEPEELTFIIGEKEAKKITPTIEPDDATNKTLIWESSNENVATVNNKGEVTAVGVGTCAITAKLEKNPSMQATCAVTVNDLIINVNYEPNGNTEYKQSHIVGISANATGSEISSIKYKWSAETSGITENDFIDAETCNNGDTITKDGITGTYYLWTLVETKLGLTKVERSNSFEFDNIAPQIENLGVSPNDYTSLKVEFDLVDYAKETGTIIQVYLDDVRKDDITSLSSHIETIMPTPKSGTFTVKIVPVDIAGNFDTYSETGETLMPEYVYTQLGTIWSHVRVLASSL